MSKGKELAKATDKELAELNAGWGQPETVDADDLVLTKYNLMQGLSDAVSEGTFKLGDIVDLATMEKIGGTDKPVKLVPFKMEKFIYKIKDDGGRGELEEVQDYRANFKREEVINGQKYKFVLNYRVFFIKEGEATPVVMDFRSTSARTGKQIATHMKVNMPRKGKNPAAEFLEISSKKEKNDKGTFAVLAVKPAGDTPIELQKEALGWYQTLAVKEYNVEDNVETKQDNNEEVPF